MKPQNTPRAVLFETESEVGILRSYFGGDQPTVFSEPILAERRKALVVSMDEARRLGAYPLAVTTEDIEELVIPAVDFAMAEVPDGAFVHYRLKPLADFKLEVQQTVVMATT